MKDIAEVIRKRRKELSLTKSDVVVKLQLAGLSLTWEAYNAFEKGEFDLRATKIIYLCYILGLKIKDFVV